MIFHFFILLFNVGGNETDINNIYNDFHLFISLLIIASLNVKWPKESVYKEVQYIIQLILCYTLYFYVNTIREVDIYIKKI